MLESIDIALANILYDEINDYNFSKLYTDIYSNYDERLKYIFSYLHQNLNELINFMNDKSKSNSHYNANESRELLFIIETIQELQAMLKNTNLDFSLNGDYERFLEYSETFLSSSGGSEIPNDYKRFTIIKYEPIFRMNNDVIITNNIGITNFKTKLIGNGAYANVLLYTDEFYNEKFAIKRLKNNVSDKEKVRFKNEFEIMSKIKHPYILKVYTYNEKDNSYIMEYCDFTLRKYIEVNNNKSEFDTKKRKKIAIQFLIALNYLHSKKILHRDISYNNVLIKLYDNDILLLKLSDFGLVKDLDLELTRTESEIRGTLIDDTLTSFKDYNVKNEIYSVGMILYFIFTGRTHLKADDSNIYNIVSKCIDRDLQKRYNNINEIIIDVQKIGNIESNINEISTDFISEKAKKILFSCIDKDGFMYTENSKYQQEFICGTLKLNFGEISIREKAEWISAIEELEKKGYIVGHKENSSFYDDDFDNTYEVMKKGFDYYDKHNN